MRSTAEVLFSLWIHAGFMAVSVVFKTQGPDQRCFHYKISCFGVVFTGDVLGGSVFKNVAVLVLDSCWIHAKCCWKEWVWNSAWVRLNL